MPDQPLQRWAALERHCPSPCSARTHWLARSTYIIWTFAPSPTSKSSWCRTLPPRPSSPLRMRGCSASCGNRCNSRPPPPTCSRSSAARRSIFKRCSTRWWNWRPDCATRDNAFIYRRDGQTYRLDSLRSDSRPNTQEFMVERPIAPGRDTATWPRDPRRQGRPYSGVLERSRIHVARIATARRIPHRCSACR